MSEELVADIAVNFSAVAALAISLGTIAVRGRWSPVERRLAVALTLVLLLFVLRGQAWIQGVQMLGAIALVPAILLPIAMLCLTEGLLRRHAPFWLKVAVSAATLAMIALLVVGAHADILVFGVALASFQAATLIVLAWLLLTRDRSSLGRIENRTIDVFMAIGAAMLPLLLTDFRTLVPEIPVRMAAVGVTALVFAILRLGRDSASVGRCVGEVLGAIAGSIVAGLAIAFVAGVHEPAAQVRLVIVLTAFVLTALVAVVAYVLHVQSRRASFLSTLLDSDSRDQDEFVSEAARHPALADMRVLGPRELEAYSPGVLRDAFRDRQVLSMTDLSEAAPGLIERDGREQMCDLLQSHRMSHVLLLCRDPLKLALLDLPDMALSAGKLLELRLFQRLAQLMGTKGAGQ
jgi:hypothetical protein